MYIIKIQTHNGHGCWFKSTHGGDPNRTLIKDSALKFAKKSSVERMVRYLSKQYPNRSFELEKYSID